MTARPQQMPDGQDKSDDLIAELAKLMAGNTTPAPEPEGNPAPKLVTLPDAPKPQASSPAPIRIPGMDTPAAAAPQVQPAPAVTPSPSPAQSAPAPVTPGVLRIPGMDRPVSVAPAGSAPTPSIGSAPAPSAAAAPAPTVSTAPAPVAPRPVESKPAASFDFGSAPAASTFKPEPMASWQDREIPKPVPSRPAPTPAVSTSPEPPRPIAPAVSAGMSAISSAAPPKADVPSPRVEPSVAGPLPAPKPAASAPAPVSPMVEAAKASPAADNFDFDFGFATNPPGPIGGEPAKPAPAVPAAASEDPIADLIAAELDSADAEAGEEPRPVQPAPRSFPQPGAAPVPQQRPAQAGPVPFRPNQAPVPAQPQASKPEDRFGVAPVFGPAGRSQVAARPQQPASDPMEEIESLIGEAVRVELTTDKPTPAPAPVPAAPMVRANAQSAPVVPPLTAGIPPRRAAIKDKDSDANSPEAAILAAAAASGAEVGRIDSVKGEASPYKRVKAKPERRSGGMRQYVGMAVAGTLLLAAGFGLYWVLGMGRGTDADAPVLTADATPVKEVPPPAPASTATQQGAVVFNELDGGNATVPTDEQLVSRDDSAATSVADVARTVGEGGDAASESELANRKVRTVTVRPDGTIVSGDEAVAGNEELPVDRPNVPDLPGADVQPSELLASIPGDPSAADAAAAATGQPAVDPTQVAALAPSPGATIDPSIVAPIPVARPTNRAALASGASPTVASAQPVDLGASQPAPAPVAAAPAAPSSSGPYVQLSSQPSQADAESALRSTQNRLANILGGRSLAVRQVDLGAKGTWYRVVLPVPTFQDATDTCAGLKSNGIDCVPIGG